MDTHTKKTMEKIKHVDVKRVFFSVVVAVCRSFDIWRTLFSSKYGYHPVELSVNSKNVDELNLYDFDNKSHVISEQFRQIKFFQLSFRDLHS